MLIFHCLLLMLLGVSYGYFKAGVVGRGGHWLLLGHGFYGYTRLALARPGAVNYPPLLHILGVMMACRLLLGVLFFFVGQQDQGAAGVCVMLS